MKSKIIFRLAVPLLLAGLLLGAAAGCGNGSATQTTAAPTATAEDFKLSGVIQSKGADSWVIGGYTFKVDSNTVLDSGLNVGVTARVEYVVLADGSWRATEIQTP